MGRPAPMSLIDEYLNELRPKLEARGDPPESIDFLFKAIRGLVQRNMEKGWSEKGAIEKVIEVIDDFRKEVKIRHPYDGQHR